MCEFISWIEADRNQILYLTNHELFETRRGREFIKENPSREDWVGHGAIRNYWNIPGTFGITKECDDFSTPNNFPKEIAEDIKAGRFSKLGMAEGLLTPKAQEKHEAVRKQILEKYEGIIKSAWEKYEAVRKPAWQRYRAIKKQTLEKYKAIEKQTLEKYKAIEKQAWEKYNAVRKLRIDEYETTKLKAFWELFADPKNRPEQWR